MFDENALRGQQEGPVNELALFTGAGGGVLGGHLLGWTTVCAVEKEPYRREVLLRRQRDGVLPLFPIWDDAGSFGKDYPLTARIVQALGRMDDLVVSAGFPCQPFSVAGKQQGADDERNGWPDTIRIIREVRPRYAFLENVPGLLTSGYFGTVLGDLAEAGYDAVWTVLGADDVGAPHRRKRLWILAYPDCEQRGSGSMGSDSRTDGGHHTRRGGEMANASGGRCGQPQGGEVQLQRGAETISAGSFAWWDIDPADLPDAEEQPERAGLREDGQGGERRGRSGDEDREGDPKDIPDSHQGIGHGGSCHVQMGRGGGTKETQEGGDAKRVQRSPESRVGRLAHGVAHRVDRLSALGDGQVPAVAAAAWTMLSRSLQ